MTALSCPDCGERTSSDPGRHWCRVIDNRTGLRIGQTVRVGSAQGQIVSLNVAGNTGTAEVYFRSTFRSGWYPTGQIEQVLS